MIENFWIFHKKEPGSKDLALPEPYFHMGTCLRSLVFLWGKPQVHPLALSGYSSYRGEEAYEFILKIICGLESPMLGETEIFGQFKEFIKNQKSTIPGPLREVFDGLLRDTKKIRAQFLQNLGCTSYGSLLRKQLKNKKVKLYVLGAGSLAQDIFPWFAKTSAELKAYTRNPEKHQQLSEQQENLKIQAFTPIEGDEDAVLVVAAPLSAEQILKWMDTKKFSHVYDLRANSHEDILPAQNLTTLKALFSDLENHRKQAMEVKQNAEVAVRKQAHMFGLTEKPRPFGWEDLWSYA